jgi:hypothetical protein
MCVTPINLNSINININNMNYTQNQIKMMSRA